MKIELQGDIFGNWIPIKQINKAIKCDKKFYSKLYKKYGVKPNRKK